MTAVFLQVRLSSQRLPRKALLRLGDQTVYQRCLDVLSLVPADLYAVVTDASSAAELSPDAARRGWEVFSGALDNVLDRFVQAGRLWQPATIIRATGDNPLVSPGLAGRLLEHHRALGADYSGFQHGPLGSGVEVLQRQALEKAWAGSPDDYEREHVSPYLYRRPQQFRIERPAVPASYHLPEARVTLDTADDAAYLTQLWNDHPRGVPTEIEELIPWLKAHPR